LGIGTLAFWLFFLSIVPLTFVFTWIYNNTNRSTLAVILFHAMVNFTGELILLSKNADTIYSLLWFVVALGITMIWGAQSFTRASRFALPFLVGQKPTKSNRS
jgi:membrane protease YdiL (CAAX protease family)